MQKTIVWTQVYHYFNAFSPPNSLESPPETGIKKKFKVPPARPTDQPDVTEQRSGSPLSLTDSSTAGRRLFWTSQNRIKVQNIRFCLAQNRHLGF